MQQLQPPPPITDAAVIWFTAAEPGVCWRRLFISDQIKIKEYRRLRKEGRKVPSCASTAWRWGFLLTQMTEILFYGTPGVFGNKGLHKTPWLLLVFHIRIHPDNKNIDKWLQFFATLVKCNELYFVWVIQSIQNIYVLNICKSCSNTQVWSRP